MLFESTIEDKIDSVRRLAADGMLGEHFRVALREVADLAALTLHADVKRTGRVHDLKTWPEFYGDVITGLKTHEIRRNDRDYQRGDVLLLREWNPHVTPAGPIGYSGRYTVRLVTYVTPGGKWGLPDNVCVMSIAPHPEALPTTEGT